MPMRIEAPKLAPRVGGLLEVVSTLGLTGDKKYGFIDGVIFESQLTGRPRFWVEGEEKSFDDFSVTPQEFDPFTVYQGVKSSIINDGSVEKSALQEAFDGSATYAVEGWVRDNLLNTGTVIETGPVTNARLAVGMVEQWGAENINALPFIHANRKAVSMMRDLKEIDGVLHTKQGTPIANGGGYGHFGPSGAPATANQAWIYVSIKPTILASETEFIPDVYELKANDRYSLIEKSYLPIIEGPVGAVLLEG